MDDPLLLPVQGEIAPRKALMLIEKVSDDKIWKVVAYCSSDSDCKLLSVTCSCLNIYFYMTKL